MEVVCTRRSRTLFTVISYFSGSDIYIFVILLWKERLERLIKNELLLFIHNQKLDLTQKH